jgi:hypothetical protein
MFQEKSETSVKLWLLLFICLSILVGGCAGASTGHTSVNISHDPLQQITNKKKGELLFNQLVDSRPPDKKMSFGSYKPTTFTSVSIGLPDGVKLEPLVTKCFAEALKEAGYDVVISDSTVSPGPGNNKFDAVINGEITRFSLAAHMKVWVNLDVKITALDPTSKKQLWEKTIHGDKTNTLWVASTSELEQVFKEAMTAALNKAAQEFASDEFYNAIKKK